jgi:hypothetical protein
MFTVPVTTGWPFESLTVTEMADEEPSFLMVVGRAVTVTVPLGVGFELDEQAARKESREAAAIERTMRMSTPDSRGNLDDCSCMTALLRAMARLLTVAFGKKPVGCKGSIVA